MKHEKKEWYTCDRCGAEIEHYGDESVKISMEDFFIHSQRVMMSNVYDETIAMKVQSESCEYDLCPKCKKEFQSLLERFMKNEHDGGN